MMNNENTKNKCEKNERRGKKCAKEREHEM